MPLEKDLTKAEWEIVKASFDTMFGTCRLICDGHEILLSRGPVKNRLTTMIYVDGWYRGSWTKDDPEFKFLRPVKTALYSRAELERLARCHRSSRAGKLIAQELAKKSFSYFTPFWPAFAPFRAHLRRVCTRIELVPKDKPTELSDV